MTIEFFLCENELKSTYLEPKQGISQIFNSWIIPFQRKIWVQLPLPLDEDVIENNVYASKEPDNTSAQLYENGPDNQ